MAELNNKVALITAGSRGLGAAIVGHLASQGADVAFTYINNTEAARQTEAKVLAMHRKCLSLQADVSDFQLAQQVTDEVIRQFGKIDFLVCNAGISKSAAIWKLTEDDWDQVVDVCLKGNFNYIRAVSAHFMERNEGKIVSIGSINGLRGRIGSVSYNVAKAGLVGLVKTAAAELGRFNVNVNLIAPGFIETPLSESAPELIRDLVLKECAIKRLGTPEDIAPVVGFLCSEQARHITGQIIKVDAGQYI